MRWQGKELTKLDRNPETFEAKMELASVMAQNVIDSYSSLGVPGSSRVDHAVRSGDILPVIDSAWAQIEVEYHHTPERVRWSPSSELSISLNALYVVKTRREDADNTTEYRFAQNPASHTDKLRIRGEASDGDIWSAQRYAKATRKSLADIPDEIIAALDVVKPQIAHGELEMFDQIMAAYHEPTLRERWHHGMLIAKPHRFNLWNSEDDSSDDFSEDETGWW